MRPPPCNSGRIGISEDPNIILFIPYSHYYWAGGPPKIDPSTANLQKCFSNESSFCTESLTEVALHEALDWVSGLGSCKMNEAAVSE